MRDLVRVADRAGGDDDSTPLWTAIAVALPTNRPRSATVSGTKTMAMKRLDAARIAYEALAYPSTIRDAAEVAAHLGIPPATVYKTLVVQRAAGRPLLVMLAADRQLDLKAPGRGRRGEEAPAGRPPGRRAAHRLLVGGISALAVRDGAFDVCVDAAALAVEAVCVSSGQRGLNLRVRTADLDRRDGRAGGRGDRRVTVQGVDGTTLGRRAAAGGRRGRATALSARFESALCLLPCTAL
ncbi:MAG: YbaK/EbsC family protein [Anaerolineae bacterium]